MKRALFCLLLHLCLPGCTIGIIDQTSLTLAVPTTPAPSAAPTRQATIEPTTPTPSAMVEPTLPPAEASPTPTHRPPTPTTTPTPWPVLQPPSIQLLAAMPMQAGPGESVTIAWESIGGTQATLEINLEPRSVPASGSTTFAIDEDRRSDVHVSLTVSNDADQVAYGSTIIYLICPYTYFFDPTLSDRSCPYRPACFPQAAQQSFENGRMIWLEGIPTESTRLERAEEPAIFVLYGDGQFPQWERFEDTWTSDQPDSDSAIVPPDGRYQPVRAFGKLWRSNTEVRERLGWAIEEEVPFDGAYQLRHEPNYDSDAAYLRTSEGRVVYLDILGMWHYVEIP